MEAVSEAVYDLRKSFEKSASFENDRIIVGDNREMQMSRSMTATQFNRLANTLDLVCDVRLAGSDGIR